VSDDKFINDEVHQIWMQTLFEISIEIFNPEAIATETKKDKKYKNEVPDRIR